ncbi:hypothetical protein KC350_g68 [Hortaea werneckii]|nr:hypothetical protein KC350_g68 [Hortaea werneckii]
MRSGLAFWSSLLRPAGLALAELSAEAKHFLSHSIGGDGTMTSSGSDQSHAFLRERISLSPYMLLIHHLGDFLARIRCRMYLVLPLVLAHDIAVAVSAVSAPSDSFEVMHWRWCNVNPLPAHHLLFVRSENSPQHSACPSLPFADAIRICINPLSFSTDFDSRVLHTEPATAPRSRPLRRVMLGDVSSQAVSFPHQLVLFLPDHLPLLRECLVRGLFKEVKAVSRAKYLTVLSTQERVFSCELSGVDSRRRSATSDSEVASYTRPVLGIGVPCLSCLGLAALANGGAAIPGSESEYLRFRLADAEAGVRQPDRPFDRASHDPVRNVEGVEREEAAKSSVSMS